MNPFKVLYLVIFVLLSATSPNAYTSDRPKMPTIDNGPERPFMPKIQGEHDPNTDELNEMLFDKAGSGTPEEIQSIVDLGADVHTTDKSGRTALFFAAAFGTLENMEKLIDLGLDLYARNRWGGTILFFAAAFGRNPDRIPQLGAMGLDLHATDKDGKTALFSAAQFGTPQNIQMLVKLGVNPNATDKYGNTALDVAIHPNKKILMELQSKHKPSTSTGCYSG